MFTYKPDYEDAARRMDAWWAGEILDRVPALISVSKPAAECRLLPEKRHASIRDLWLDTEFKLEMTEAKIANTIYLAEALPIAYPNLGPEIFSAFYGCPLEFGESTSWSEPFLHSLEPEELDKVRLDRSNFYYRQVLEMTKLYIEAGRGKFIVGYTDLHGGGDAIAAFRDPQQLCFDLLENPDAIKILCDRVTDDFLEVFDLYNGMIAAAGMPSTNWLPLFSSGKYHVPSNDFSCMISEEMFEDFFLPGLERECAYMTHNIYHLDGPGALRHLDRLLEIPNLHAIQWVPGSGREDWHQWIDVYKRIQAKGKGFIVCLSAADLDELTGCLSPQGVFLQMHRVRNLDEGIAVIRKLEAWR